MNDTDILKGIKKYFRIQELVGRFVFGLYKERAWRFLDFRLLHALLIIRLNLNKKITVNNWFWGGKFSQRGLRSNLQQIFRSYFVKRKLYLSAHVLGKGIDFDVEGMTACEVRLWIVQNEHLFPFKIRLEDGVNWVHLDVIYEERNSKVYLFAA